MCRHHLKAAAKAAFKGVMLLDSVPLGTWFSRQAVASGKTIESAQLGQNSLVGNVLLIASQVPYAGVFLGMAVGRGRDNMTHPEARRLAEWQIGTARNWYAQYKGIEAETSQCKVGDVACYNASVVTPANMMPVPVWAVASLNLSITCEQAGKGAAGSKQCTDWITSRKVTDDIIREESMLGSAGSQFLQCDGVCDHSFVWNRPEYVTRTIQEFLTTLPP